MKKTIIQIIILVLVLITILFVTSIKNSNNEQEKDPNVPEKVMQIYSGILPCADCEGIQTEISFVRQVNSKGIEGVYALQEFYVGKSTQPVSTEGNWKAIVSSTGKTTIIVNPDKALPEQRKFLLEPESILMLDMNGKEIKSDLNYRLNRL